MENAIEVENVTKTYRMDVPGFVNTLKYLIKPKYLTALRRVNFSVKQGEFFGLLGPNGAGKTTLIKTLLGLVGPTSGKITVLGRSIPGETEKILPRVNVVFSRAGCYWNISGMDHLLFYGKIYRVKNLKKKIRQLVDLFDLQEMINITTDKYSTGEVMRLHLARSLLNDPELIILDEPTVGLDPYIALKVRDFFHKLNKERGVTVLLTTHYMEEADRLCDRIAIIDRGRIIKIGTSDELKKEMKKENIVEIKAKNITSHMVNDLKSLAEVENVVYIGEEEKLRIILKDIKSFSSVLEFLKHEDIKISAINTDTPTLEDVFLHITGKRLRRELR